MCVGQIVGQIFKLFLGFTSISWEFNRGDGKKIALDNVQSNWAVRTPDKIIKFEGILNSKNRAYHRYLRSENKLLRKR